MAKDYAKFVPAQGRASKKSKKTPLVFLAVFGLLTLSLGYGSYVIYSQKIPLSKFTELFHRVKTNTPATAPKQIAESDDSSIHFEFYDELPNMQVGNPESLAMNTPTPDKTLDSSKPTIIATNTATTNKANDVVTPVAETVTPEVNANLSPSGPLIINKSDKKDISSETLNEDQAAEVSASKNINADDLSSLLAKEEKTDQYILNLGVFDTLEGAKLLHEAIIAVGFDPKIVPIKQGNRKIYQLQQGPYENEALAKQSKQRLAKRGIISSLQKIPT